MKKFVHKVMSICMAFVVLFTTMSFTVDMHYCGKTLVDFSVFQSPKTCGMEKMQQEVVVQTPCSTPIFAQQSCCTDKQFIAEGEDDLNNTFESLTFEHQTFVAVFTYSYNNLFEGTQSQDVPVIQYPPPLVKRDIHVLHQTFLI